MPFRAGRSTGQVNFEMLHPRDKIEQVMARVYGGEMTTTSGGNVSVRALVVGQSVLDVFDRLEVLEATAKALLSASVLGPGQPMPAAAIDELCETFGLKPAP
jgi:hypothetical protein